MTINLSQKIIFIIGLLVITAALIVWVGFGSEIFTKTQVLVEKKDELLGTTYKEWKDQFVLGLDYTLGFIGMVVIILIILVWKVRTKVQKY